MKKLYATLILIAPLCVAAQQDVQFTQYMFNKIYYNPAVAGSDNNICINGFHRSQWVGFDGAPTTQNINANIPLKKLHGGAGVSIVNDQIGNFNNVSARLMYAYQFQLTTGTVGIGVGVNFLNKSLSADGWMPADGEGSNSPLPGNMDPAIYATDASGFQVDMSFGAYYETDKIWGGISTTRLIESKAEVDNNIGQGSTFFKSSRHYYLSGGYNYLIPGSNWELRPSTLVKISSGGATTFDINAMGVYNNKMWGGVTYRLDDAIAAMVGYQITPSLKAGYSYDVGTSNLSSGQSGGSHEIMLQYCFKISTPPRIKGSYKNPRFL